MYKLEVDLLPHTHAYRMETDQAQAGKRQKERQKRIVKAKKFLCVKKKGLIQIKLLFSVRTHTQAQENGSLRTILVCVAVFFCSYNTKEMCTVK